MPTEDMYHLWDIDMRERVTRLEEKNKAAEKALELAQDKVSRNVMVSYLTIMISIISIVVAFLHK